MLSIGRAQGVSGSGFLGPSCRARKHLRGSSLLSLGGLDEPLRTVSGTGGSLSIVVSLGFDSVQGVREFSSADFLCFPGF